MRRGSGRTIPVIARVSTHSLRLEREYHVTKSLKQSSDPNCVHTVVQIEFVRLPTQQGDREPLVVSIFESPGPNYLKELVNFGPAWYTGSNQPKSLRDSISSSTDSPGEHIPLPIFLEFAIGASECLELLHHGQNTVHGEIRADAFHFNQKTGTVKLINFGSGRRSFENGLTSAGWSSLSKELGVKNKLQFIAPEQTGRMPAEPDSRTDIYSLGVLFWSMLTREPAFDGDTPMDIVQSALSRRLPPVSSIRMDIPDVLSSVIQRMTQKQIDERYHSVSGLKHDIVEIHKMLGDGDEEALKNFVIGSRDVSSFFVLPASLFGRQEQHEKILRVVEKVSKRQRFTLTKENGYRVGSNTSISNETLELADGSSDASSRGGRDSRTNSAANAVNYTWSPNPDQVSNHLMQHSPVTSKVAMHKDDSRDSIATRASVNTLDTATTWSNGLDGQLNNGLAHLTTRRNSQKSRRRERCEVITISGGAGLGKTSLVQSVQPFIRKLG
jgi:serine/threonine protein kinase